jgi:LPXTG-motif cell wall-anchored protein
MSSIFRIKSHISGRSMIATGLIIAAVAAVMIIIPTSRGNVSADNCPNPKAQATLNAFPVTYTSPAEMCHDYPALDARLVNGGRYSQSQADHANGVTANEGDEIYVLSYIHNSAANNLGDSNMAKNVRIKTHVPSTVGSSHTITTSFRGDNTNAVSGSFTVQTPAGMRLEVVPNSGEMFDYKGANKLRGGFDITNAEYNIGDLRACFEYSVFVRFKVKVVKHVVVTPPAPPAPQPQQPTVINIVNNNQNNNQNTLQNINQNGSGNSANTGSTQGSNQQATTTTGSNTAVTPSQGTLVCAQVITRAINPATGEIRDFPTSCLPAGWVRYQATSSTGTGSSSSSSSTTVTTTGTGTAAVSNNQNNNQNGLSNINQNGSGNSASSNIHQSSAQTATTVTGIGTAAAVATSQSNNQNTVQNINQNNPTVAGMTLSKKAWNDTKNVDATSTAASREDFITYQLTVTNTSTSSRDNFVIQDDLSGVLPFADIVDFGGGTLNGQTIVYPATNIAAGQTVTKTFRVRVKFHLQNNLTFVMTNTYGNTVNVHIGSMPGVATPVAPKTGSAATSAAIFAGLMTSGFVVYRKRREVMNLILA